MSENDQNTPSPNQKTEGQGANKPRNAKKLIAAVLALLIVGGFAYTASQTDFFYSEPSTEGQSSPDQSEQNIEVQNPQHLGIYSELGSSYTKDAEEILAIADDTDCEKYSYEWESSTLTCEQGVSQLKNFGEIEVAIGKTLQMIAEEKATRTDISSAIAKIDELNQSYSDEIISYFLDEKVITENRRSNTNNKTALQALLDRN